MLGADSGLGTGSRTISRKYCIITFIIGAAVFLISAVPFIMQSGGIFYFYGDFNAQQVPFTVSFAGTFSVPQYDFKSCTGMDYLDACSFYNLFSPFTLIFRLLPADTAVYLFPLVIALKFGFCSMNAYIYISRFCRTDGCAAAGAMLYAFSGYCMVTMNYHYLDSLALFPLLPASLEAAVTEKRKAVFSVSIALCAFTNYYIFGIEAVFLILYFLIRLTDGSFRISLGDFFRLAAETLMGLAAAGLVLVPAAIYMLNSPRLDSSFSGAADMLLYETPWRYARILQSIFIVPDIQGYTNFFPDAGEAYPFGSRFSSQALYLPLFGASGVIAFASANKKSWQTRLIAVCIVFALVPVLNSVFSMGSPLYYARWMFAPTLIMACMTAKALEGDPKHFRAGILINGAAVAAIAVFSVVFPIEKLSMWKSTYYNNVQKWSQIAITALGLGIAAVLVFRSKRDGQFQLKALTAVTAAVFVFTEYTVLFGMGGVSYPEASVYSFTEKPVLESSEYGKRIVTDDNMTNENMIWDIPSAYCFTSTVTREIYDYCRAVGIMNDDIPDNYISHCLLSVKELISYDYTQKSDDEYSSGSIPASKVNGQYNFAGRSGNYLIYENQNFIPIGFCYDYCISEETLLNAEADARSSLMLKAMAVEDTSAVSEYLTEIGAEDIRALEDWEIAEECSARAARSARSFRTDGNSFTAEITLDEPELVFFSVTFSEDFTAYVDGSETEMIKANFGFQAIPVPAGSHTVRCVYHSRKRDIGAVCTAAGAAAIAAYGAASYILKRKSVRRR